MKKDAKKKKKPKNMLPPVKDPKERLLYKPQSERKGGGKNA